MSFDNLPLPELSKIADNPDASPRELHEVITRLRTFEADGSPCSVTLTGCGDLKLQLYTWRCYGQQKGAVILVHGLYSHARHAWVKWVKPGSDILNDKKTVTPAMFVKFEGSWIDQLTRKGFTVVAYDQQGFGLSEGWQGHRGTVECFDNFAKDAQIVVSYVRQSVCQGKNTPVSLIGSSLGGAVILRMLEIGEGNPVDSVVLLAPMLMIPGAPPSWLASPLLAVVNRLNPHGFMSARDRHDTPEQEAAFMSDPLTFKGGLRYSMARACLTGANKTLESAHVVTNNHTKCLFVIHSEIDHVIDIRGTRALIDRLKSVTNKKFVALEAEEGFAHSLAMGPKSDVILALVLEYLEANGSKQGKPGLAKLQMVS